MLWGHFTCKSRNLSISLAQNSPKNCMLLVFLSGHLTNFPSKSFRSCLLRTIYYLENWICCRWILMKISFHLAELRNCWSTNFLMLLFVWTFCWDGLEVICFSLFQHESCRGRHVLFQQYLNHVQILRIFSNDLGSDLIHCSGCHQKDWLKPRFSQVTPKMQSTQIKKLGIFYGWFYNTVCTSLLAEGLRSIISDVSEAGGATIFPLLWPVMITFNSAITRFTFRVLKKASMVRPYCIAVLI